MKKNACFVLLFFLLLALLAGLTLGLPAREFSEHENRNLAQRPVLTGEGLLSGTFQEALDSYLSDQIPLRDFWIRMHTGLKKAMGQREINGVYLGEDGYYFRQFTQDSFSPSREKAVFALLEQFAQAHPGKVTLMPVPTPALVLQDKLPENAPVYDGDGAWQRLQAATPSAALIDLRPAFAASQEQLYYRTDHHWTTRGAYVAYGAFCEARGLTARQWEDFDPEQVSGDFLGTLYSRILDPAARPEELWAIQDLPPVTVTVDGGRALEGIYAPEFLEKKDQYAYFFGGNFGRVEIDTPADNGKTLVVIKDSFANCFVPYLLQEYDRIVLLDLRYFDGSVPEETAGATEILVLYEMTNLLTDTGINRLAR